MLNMHQNCNENALKCSEPSIFTSATRVQIPLGTQNTSYWQPGWQQTRTEEPMAPTGWVLIWCGIVVFLALLGIFAGKSAEDSAGDAEAVEDYDRVSNGSFGCAVVILICAYIALKLWFGW